MSRRPSGHHLVARCGQLIRQVRSEGLSGQLARGGIGSVLVKFANTALSMLLVAVLARTLGPEGYGVYTYVLAFVSLMAVPAQLGLATLVVRETARAFVERRWALMRGLWRWAATTVAVFSLALALIGAVLLWAASDRFTVQQVDTFWWGILLVPVIALGNLRGAALRGLRKVLQGQLPEHILRPAILALLVVVSAVYTAGPVEPNRAMALHVLSAVIAFMVGALLLWRARPAELAKSRECEYESRAWLASLMPLGLISGMQLVNKYTDLLMLGLLATATDVGVYRVSAQAALLVAFGLHAANMAVAPHISHLYAQGDLERLQKVITGTSRAMVVSAAPVVGVLVLFGEELLTWACGPEYAAGSFSLSMLALGRLVANAVGPVALLLGMSGNERITALAATCGAIGNIVLNYLLIPHFGMNGAAVATSVTFVAWHVIMWQVARKKLGIETLPVVIGRPIGGRKT